MTAHRIWALVSRQLYIFKHSPVRLIEMVYWPLLDLVLWGFVSVYMRHVTPSAGNTLMAFFLGALILWDVLYRAQQGVSLAYLEEVWARNLLNLFVAPLTVAEFLTSIVLVSLSKLAFSVVIMAVLALVLYGFNLLSLGVALIFFFASLLIFGWSMGIVTTALVLRFGQGAENLAWVVAFAFQPIACVFYPVAVLPIWLRPVALATPAAHVFEGMRDVITGHSVPWAHLAWAFGLNAIYLAIALAFFNWTFQLVRERGLLAKTGE